jgi:uncharacterized protein
MKKEKLQIKLAEIPEEGKTYSYTQDSGELNLGLKDLIDEKPYRVSFTVTPIGNVYEVKGELNTSFPRVCSRCGWDIEIPVQSKISELLIPKTQEERGDTQSKSGFLSDNDETAVTYFTGGVLDAENMLHEILALKEPPYPSCEKDDCEHLEEANARIERLKREADEATHSVNVNPFSTLKGIKF